MPVSQFAASLHSPPDGAPVAVVAIQTTAAVSVPVIVTVISWVTAAPCESVTVTV